MPKNYSREISFCDKYTKWQQQEDDDDDDDDYFVSSKETRINHVILRGIMRSYYSFNAFMPNGYQDYGCNEKVEVW